MSPHEPDLSREKPRVEPIVASTSGRATSSATPAPEPAVDLNFSHYEIKLPASCYSSRGSVRETSSGILEVLNELENEGANTTALKRIETKSNQDLTRSGKKESRESVLKSLLKRTHSAPKKLNAQKVQKRTKDVVEEDEDEEEPTVGELAPYQQIRCCHPLVEKLKTMADKQLHKNKPQKKVKTIKTVAVPDKQKIILAEQTRIIRLKESPRADRKNVAAYIEKRDSEDFVEILELDESPTETRRRREEGRRVDDQEKSLFVVPLNVTQAAEAEPTVEELLEEEFKNDPPKKSPRKTKEHIYEDVSPVDDVPPVDLQSMLAEKLQQTDISAEEPREEPKNEQTRDEPKQTVEQEPTEELVVHTEEEAKQDEEVEIPVNGQPSKPRKAHLQKLSEIEVSVDEPQSPQLETETVEEEKSNSSLLAPHPKPEGSHERSDKKVTFSMSTEEYQEKIAAERAPEKEDVALPEHLIKPKTDPRWSDMK